MFLVAHSQPERAEKLKMIPEPSQETPTQIGMGLARTDEGKALYLAAQETVRDCIKRADMDLALTRKRQPLERKLLVINSKKIAYLQRMEGDWATERLGVQALKNRRVRAYKQNTLPRPAGYEHLKINASKRSASGSRVPKAKLYLEDRRARKARERERESREMDGPPRKRARVENRQPEFVQGSSRDMHPVGNEWDAHPEIDEDYVPGNDDNFGGSEDKRNADPDADDSDEEEEDEETF
ncbi:hypothetical protein R3P38DRAFT_2777229 [Favolaschia claudopus]|uniref:Uncharacterized protein n=1 Tax=Favolaschia claudopus TaxID=2862362 RepID=A0AAW0BL81_9AGAR